MSFDTSSLKFHTLNYVTVRLTCRVYNVAAMSFTPEMIYHEVKKHVPNLAIDYKIDDRQKIGKIIFFNLLYNSINCDNLY